MGIIFYVALFLVSTVQTHASTTDSSSSSSSSRVQAALLLTEGRSGSTFVGEILNQDPRVLYFYEPCRTLNWGDGSGAGSVVVNAREQCEALVVRLLSCNATESDLRTLLKDWRAAKHDAALLKLAAASGALKGFDPSKPNNPGVVVKAGPAREHGRLGFAYAGKCRSSWRVVKELAHRFESPIPKSVSRSIRESRQGLTRGLLASGGSNLGASSTSKQRDQGPLAGLGSGDDDKSGDNGGGGNGGDSGGGDAKMLALCAATPNHWACTGVDALRLQQQQQQQQLRSQVAAGAGGLLGRDGGEASSSAALPPIKVLHLVRDVRGVILSRLKLEAFCGDTAPLLCARPLCQAMRNTVVAARQLVGEATAAATKLETKRVQLVEQEARLKAAFANASSADPSSVGDGVWFDLSGEKGFEARSEVAAAAAAADSKLNKWQRQKKQLGRQEARVAFVALETKVRKTSELVSRATAASQAAQAAAGLSNGGLHSVYTLVRYEDFALDPQYRAKVLFRWLGLLPQGSSGGSSDHDQLLPTSVSKWLERATQAKRGDGDFGTSRTDSKQVAAQWVSHLPRPTIEVVTAECSDVLEALKYPVEGYLPPALGITSATGNALAGSAAAAGMRLGAIRASPKGSATAALVASAASSFSSTGVSPSSGSKAGFLATGMPGSPTSDGGLVGETAAGRAARMRGKSRAADDAAASALEQMGARKLVDWSAVESELARITKAHPFAVRKRATVTSGSETRAALREALGRMVTRASDVAAYILMEKTRSSDKRASRTRQRQRRLLDRNNTHQDEPQSGEEMQRRRRRRRRLSEASSTAPGKWSWGRARGESGRGERERKSSSFSGGFGNRGAGGGAGNHGGNDGGGGGSSSLPPPPPPVLNIGVVGGAFAAGVGGKLVDKQSGRQSWRFPSLVAAGLQKVFPYASVNVVADGSKPQFGSLTSALCLDALIGAPSLNGDGFGGRRHDGSGVDNEKLMAAAAASSSSNNPWQEQQDGEATGASSVGGSGVGSASAENDVDILFTEFALDDAAHYKSDALPFELLLRAGLSRRPQRPAVVNVMGWGRRLSWATAQDRGMAEVCKHYGVSAISVRDALLPLVRSTSTATSSSTASASSSSLSQYHIESQAPLTAKDLAFASHAGFGDASGSDTPLKNYYNYPDAAQLCGFDNQQRSGNSHGNSHGGEAGNGHKEAASSGVGGGVSLGWMKEKEKGAAGKGKKGKKGKRRKLLPLAEDVVNKSRIDRGYGTGDAIGFRDDDRDGDRLEAIFGEGTTGSLNGTGTRTTRKTTRRRHLLSKMAQAANAKKKWNPFRDRGSGGGGGNSKHGGTESGESGGGGSGALHPHNPASPPRVLDHRQRGPGDELDEALGFKWCLPDAKIHSATADFILAYLLTELVAWRDAGRNVCRNPSADPNAALLTGGCRYFGRRHHASSGGGFSLRDDPKMAKYLKMMAMPRVPKDSVMKKMAQDGVDPKLLNLDVDSLSPHSPPGATSLGPRKGSSDQPYEPPHPPLALKAIASASAEKQWRQQQQQQRSSSSSSRKGGKGGKGKGQQQQFSSSLGSPPLPPSSTSVRTSAAHYSRSSALLLEAFPLVQSAEASDQKQELNSFSSSTPAQQQQRRRRRRLFQLELNESTALLKATTTTKRRRMNAPYPGGGGARGGDSSSNLLSSSSLSFGRRPQCFITGTPSSSSSSSTRSSHAPVLVNPAELMASLHAAALAMRAQEEQSGGSGSPRGGRTGGGGVAVNPAVLLSAGLAHFKKQQSWRERTGKQEQANSGAHGGGSGGGKGVGGGHYDSGWSLQTVRPQPLLVETRHKLGLSSDSDGDFGRQQFPEYLVSSRPDAEALLQVDVVKGLVFVVACPHHWQDASDQEEEELENASKSSVRAAQALKEAAARADAEAEREHFVGSDLQPDDGEEGGGGVGKSVGGVSNEDDGENSGASFKISSGRGGGDDDGALDEAAALAAQKAKQVSGTAAAMWGNGQEAKEASEARLEAEALAEAAAAGVFKASAAKTKAAVVQAAGAEELRGEEELPEEFNSFREKLKSMQRVKEHHFKAKLLHYPITNAASSSPLTSESVGGWVSEGSNTAFRRKDATFDDAALFQGLEHLPPFKRRPVLVNGKPVEVLVPVLGVSNEVWQLTPTPPPGRYLLQITPNEALDPNFNSPSCFHAVVVA